MSVSSPCLPSAAAFVRRCFGATVVGLALAACAAPAAGLSRGSQTGPSETQAPQTSDSVQAVQRRYLPSQRATPLYGKVDHRSEPKSPELETWRRWLKAQGFGLSEGLSRVAEDAIEVLSQSPRLVPGLRDDLMAWHGRVEVDVRFSRIQGESSPSRALQMAKPLLTQALRSSANSEQRLGLAMTRRGNRWELVLVQASPRARLRPFPKRIAPGESLALRGRLAPGRQEPVMMVIDPQGHGQALKLRRQGKDYVGALVCNRGPGRYQVEWVATGPLGPEIVVNVPVYCGVQLPEAIVYLEESVSPSASRQEIETASWEMVNQVRQAQGLAPLAWDDRLAALAREHSDDMEKLDYVGHRSPQRGGFELRLDEAGLQAPLALENVASGFGPSEILDRLMASPGHRLNILNPEVTHMGVGVAIRTTLGPSRQDSLFLTQHFARFRPTRTPKGPRSRLSAVDASARSPL